MSHQPKNNLSSKRRHEELEQELMEQNAEFETKITDLNNDCLEKIFMYLHENDFINIAHTNKELKPAADMAFARKFGKKQLILNICLYRVNNSVVLGKDTVEVFDFKTFLRLLRCFGHLFSKFDVGSVNAFRGLKIVSYINEYCSESLLEIIWRYMSADAFKELKKPFASARNVEFFDCTLDGKLAQLSNWFPAMCHLRLHKTKTHLDYIDANCRDLRSLKIIGRGRNYSAERLMNALRLGPQLRYLHLDIDGWVKILQDVSASLERLDSLHINWVINDFLGADDHVFTFQHLQKLQMQYIGSNMEYFNKFNSTPRMTISFPSLQKLTWQSVNRRHLHQPIIDFLEKNPTITKFTLLQLCVSDITFIARALPLLQEVNFEDTKLSVDNVVPFLNQARLLRKVGFRMTDRSEFDRLKTLLDKEWQASIDGQRVGLEHKG